MMDQILKGIGVFASTPLICNFTIGNAAPSITGIKPSC